MGRQAKRSANPTSGVPGQLRRTDRAFARVVKLVLAILLIVLGLVGLILPVLQGILFLLIGLLLLADIIPSVAILQKKMEDRHPSIAKVSVVARRNIDAIFDRQWLVIAIAVLAFALLVWGGYLLIWR